VEEKSEGYSPKETPDTLGIVFAFPFSVPPRRRVSDSESTFRLLCI
jgi:hypothetical protein